METKISGKLPPWVQVGIGAMAGALMRLVLSPLVADEVSLLLINVVGCFALTRWKLPLGWGTGFLGGFTSYSAMTMISATPLRDGSPVASIAYLALTFVCCITSSALGQRMSKAASPSEKGEEA